MRPAKGEARHSSDTVRVELDLEKKIADQLRAMEEFTKIPKSEIVATALKRFISQHKDYFPPDDHHRG
jgi:hypothetical protein